MSKKCAYSIKIRYQVGGKRAHWFPSNKSKHSFGALKHHSNYNQPLKASKQTFDFIPTIFIVATLEDFSPICVC